MYVFSQWKINAINFVNHHEFHVSCTRSFSSCQGYLKYQVQNCCQWLLLFCYCSNSRWSILLKVYIPGIYLKCSALKQFTCKSPRVGWILCLLLVFFVCSQLRIYFKYCTQDSVLTSVFVSLQQRTEITCRIQPVWFQNPLRVHVHVSPKTIYM